MKKQGGKLLGPKAGLMALLTLWLGFVQAGGPEVLTRHRATVGIPVADLPVVPPTERRGAPARLGPLEPLPQGPALAGAPLTYAPAHTGAADRFVQAKLAEIGTGVSTAFAFVRDHIRFEAYTGSLRGARGTLWSAAGNSLDQASLLVALLGAQGLTARYVRGTLAEADTRTLIRSMFDPAVAANAVGYIPEGFPRYDPETDPALLRQASDHWWVELEDGTALDPSFPDQAAGQTRGAKIGTFDAIPNELRHTVVMRLEAEFHNPLSQYSFATPLEVVLDTADLYGRALTLGHFIGIFQPPALVTGWKTYTYSPYLMVDDNDADWTNNELIRGTDYQEFLTGLFPLANSILTRLTLEFDVRAPDRTPDFRTRDLLDRVGYAARKGLAQPGPVDTTKPALTELDVTTFFLTPGMMGPELVPPHQAVLGALDAELATLAPTVSSLTNQPVASLTGEDLVAANRYAALNRAALIAGGSVVAGAFLLDSDHYLRQMRDAHRACAYYHGPRITLFETHVGLNDTAPTLRMGLDLRRNHVLALPYPGQCALNFLAFNLAKGRVDSVLEHLTIERFLAAEPPEVRRLASPVKVLQEARAQSVRLEVLRGEADIPARLEALPLVAEAKARIADALRSGQVVNVPVRMVEVAGRPSMGWWQINPVTGEAIAVAEDGGRQEFLEFVLLVILVAFGAMFTLLALGDRIATFFTASAAPVRDSMDPSRPLNPPSSLHTEFAGLDPATVPAGEVDIPVAADWEENPDGTVTITVGDLTIRNVPSDFGSLMQAGGPAGSVIDWAGSEVEVISEYAPGPLPHATNPPVEGPGFGFVTTPEPSFVVKHRESQVPSAYRLAITNLSVADPAAFGLSGAAPDGWKLRFARTNAVIPSGAAGQVSVFLQPDGRAPLPPPETVIPFALEVVPAAAEIGPRTLASDPAKPIHIGGPRGLHGPEVSHALTFTVPEVYGLRMGADLELLCVSPDGSAACEVFFENTGNVPLQADLTPSLPPGFTLDGLMRSVTLAPNEQTALALTLQAQGVPVNSDHVIGLTASFGPNRERRRELELRAIVAVPGALQALQAASEAQAIGRNALATTLESLGKGLSQLYNSTADPLWRTRVLASLDTLQGQLDDPVLTSFGTALATERDALAAAPPEQVAAALESLGVAIREFSDVMAVLARHDFEFALRPTSATAYPAVPTEFGLYLRNLGRRTTTYELTLSALPAEVTGGLDRRTLILAPGEAAAPWIEGLEPAILTLTQPVELLTELDFQITARALEAPAIVREVRGSLSARRERAAVVGVEATPAFTDRGGTVALAARLWNAVNRTEAVQVNWAVEDGGGAVVLEGAPVTARLSVQNSVDTVTLGTVDTAGLPEGKYAVSVRIQDSAGLPLPEATANGHFFVGSPVTASLWVAPEQVPAGDGTVTVTLEVGTNVDLGEPGIRLLGVADTQGAGESLAVHSGFAYVGGKDHIAVVDVRDPRNPTLVRTFGDPGNVQGNRVAVSGNVLLVAFELELQCYALNNPAAPSWLGKRVFSDVRGTSGFYFERHGNLALINTDVSFQDSVLGIEGIRGDAIVFDVTQPLAASCEGLLFNTPHTYRPDWPGSEFFIGQDAASSGTTLYFPSSTGPGLAEGGTGRLLVFDGSDPGNLTQVGEVVVPETTVLSGAAVSGDQCLVIGATGPFAFVEGTPYPTGDYRLAVLDVSDPRQPTLVNSRVVPEIRTVLPAPEANSGIQVSPGPGRLYALRRARWEGNSELIVINAFDPRSPVTHHTPTASVVHGAQFEGTLLYAVGATGLAIYDVGGISSLPTEARVQVANDAAAAVLPGSFSREPDERLEGLEVDTLVWRLPLSPAQPARSVTWRIALEGLAPGETTRLSPGGEVSFTALGTEGTVGLPALTVVGAHLLTLAPARQETRPGEAATFQLWLSNPTPQTRDFALSVHGLPAAWATLRPSITVPAGRDIETSLALRPLSSSPEAVHAFVVLADAGDGLSSSVGGELSVVGRAAPAPSRGVVLALRPADVTAGQGTPAAVNVRLTNTGSVTETCSITVTPPPGVASGGGPPAAEVPPGLEDYRETQFLLTPEPGTAPGAKTFTVTATASADPTVQATASGTLTVLPLGVVLSLTPAHGPIGTTFTLQVSNPGPDAQTYDLTVGGPLGAAARLGQSSVTLDPGAATTVPVMLSATHFAYPGEFPLLAGATARADTRVRAFAVATVAVSETHGLEAWFDPELTGLLGPGAAAAMLYLRNAGNVEETCKLEIVGVEGPLTASLQGMDGQATRVIPRLRLPGLAGGAMLVRASLTASQPGRVHVRLASLSHPDRSVEATAHFLPGVWLSIEKLEDVGGQRTHLWFAPLPGYQHTVEYQDALGTADPWLTLPAAPHNQGDATDREDVTGRFYRLRIAQP